MTQQYPLPQTINANSIDLSSLNLGSSTTSDSSTIFSDSFTDTNGTDILTHALDEGVLTWQSGLLATTSTLSSPVGTINNNQLVINGDNNLIYLTTGLSDCVVKATWTPAVGQLNRNSLVLRYSSNGEGILVFNFREDNNDIRIIEYTASVATDLVIQPFTFTEGASYIVEAKVVGTLVTASIHEVGDLLTKETITATTSFSTGLSQGLARNTGSSLSTFDDFSISTSQNLLEVTNGGSSVSAAVTKLNFLGSGVNATSSTEGEVDVTINQSPGTTLEIENDGVSIDANVAKINFGSGVVATQTSSGNVEVTSSEGGTPSTTLTVLNDTFTDADNTPIASHTPETGSSWTAVGLTSADSPTGIVIDNNSLHIPTGNTGVVAFLFSPNAVISANIATGTNLDGRYGFYVRRSNTLDTLAVILREDQQDILIVSRDGDNAGLVSDNTPVTILANTTYKLEAEIDSSNVLIVRLDDVVVRTLTITDIVTGNQFGPFNNNAGSDSRMLDVTITQQVPVGGSLIIEDNGTPLSTSATKLNFTNFTITEPNPDEFDITAPASGTGVSSGSGGTGVKLTNSTDTPIPAGTTVKIPFDTEEYDEESYFGTNTTDSIIPETGQYNISAQFATLLTNTAGIRSIRVHLNGSIIARREVPAITDNSTSTHFGVSLVNVRLTAGDVLDVRVFSSTATTVLAVNGFFLINKSFSGSSTTVNGTGSVINDRALAFQYEAEDKSDSISGRTLSTTGTVSLAAGKTGNAFSFTDNSANRLTAQASEDGHVFGNKDWFIGAWVNPATATGFKVVYAKDRFSDRPRVLNFFLDGTNHLSIILGFENNTIATYVSNAVISANVFTHVLATHNAETKTVELYVNGALDASFTYTETAYDSGVDIPHIGVRRSSTNSYDIPFNGLIDQVIKGDFIPTLQEIASIYNSGDGVTDAQSVFITSTSGGGIVNSPSPQPVRESYVGATTSLADNASEDLDLTFPIAAVVANIATDVPALIRAYSNKAARTADTRDNVTAPTVPTTGLIFEYRLVAGQLSEEILPILGFVNLETEPVSEIYLRIFNESGSANAVSVSLEASPIATGRDRDSFVEGSLSVPKQLQSADPYLQNLNPGTTADQFVYATDPPAAKDSFQITNTADPQDPNSKNILWSEDGGTTTHYTLEPGRYMSVHYGSQWRIFD